MRSSKNILENQGGFTLLEILLVVAIVAILVTMAVPQISGTKFSAYELSAMRAIRAVGSAEQAYQNSYGTFVPWGSLQARNYISPNYQVGGLSDKGRIAKHYSLRIYIDGPIVTPRGTRFTGYSIIAVPLPGFGLRYFRMQEDGTLEQSSSGTGGWEVR